MNISTPIEIPYWIIVFISTCGIIFLIMNAKDKKDVNFRLRYLLSVIPRIYFTVIYTWFWLYNPAPEIRALWGRSGIVYILAVDLWICFAEWFDYNWDTKWQFIWMSRYLIMKRLKINLNKKWEKLKWTIKHWRS